MNRVIWALTTAALLGTALPATAKSKPRWTVKREWVRAHAAFLAGPALQGRGSGTRDEAIAAAYVAAQFEGFGLKPAPGIDGYLQTTNLVRQRAVGAPILTVNGRPVGGATALLASGTVTGKLTVFSGDDAKELPAGEIVLVTSTKLTPLALRRAARAKKIKLIIATETEATRTIFAISGGEPIFPIRQEDAAVDGGALGAGSDVAAATVPEAGVRMLAAMAGADVTLRFPQIVTTTAPTTNAIGYLPGTDPKAGVILFSAHLDHLGVRGDGVVMPGANDDASGTAAVIELARALAARDPMKRGILFVAYGSEEIGGFGSTWFAAHPPVPLTSIIANLELEMIGAQDPKLPRGVMMMTGYDRSTFGEALKAHGALVTADPYPEQNFFQRSDNYSLALQGVVAHTVSGWAVVPTYHTPNDTLEALDIDFMTRAIQSLVEPAIWLANSDFKPDWKPGGKPGK